MRLSKFTAVLLIVGLLLLCGCSLGTGENTKLRDMEFTVLSEEVLPDELKGLITERKKTPSVLHIPMRVICICVSVTASSPPAVTVSR